MTPPTLFRVAVDLNLAPGLGQALLQGVLAAVTTMETRIMGALEDLQAKTEELVQTNEQLLAEVREANGKTDQLILVANTTKDALAAARDEIAALQGAATAEQLAAITSRMDAAVASATQAIADLNAQDAETDAATTAVAP
jgi:hypothetical protein